MRISRIRIAGFKSFVDPTSLVLDGSLIGVVGPNGCGKSNIIDAVNWVMGESSARSLRGDSMTDVIFNGSSTRKPVGRASVEIVLDNSDGALGGQYARYAEVSVRREVGRDGVSVYTINGTRCRRKDVTDLFLGTGVGARGYAVIGQGMISRIIEGRPEELRSFLEEAAGISRYKERRRETENRIRHTRENLERLEDIREELGRQLAHLERQARAAERYQELKAEERRTRAALEALRWRAVDEARQRQGSAVREQETRLERELAGLRALEAELVRRQQEHAAAQQQGNEANAAYYQAGAEVSRIEQSIEHARQTRARLEQEATRIEHELADAEARLAADRERLEALDRAAAAARPRLEEAETAEQEAYRRLEQAEQALRAWQQRWEAWHARAGDARQQAELAEARLGELEARQREAETSGERLRREASAIDLDGRRAAAAEVAQALAAARAEEEGLSGAHQRYQEEATAARSRIEQLTEALHRARDRQRETAARIAGLEARQQAAMSTRDDALRAWLAEHGWDAVPRLVELLEVEPGWETAVEAVGRLPLDALCVDALEPLAAALGEAPPGRLRAIAVAADGAVSVPPATVPGARRLADVVRGPAAVMALLTDVHVAEDVAAARALLERLGPGGSVVTRDGVWLGAGWLERRRAGSEDDSALALEAALKAARAEEARTQREVEAIGRALDEARRALHAMEAQAPTPARLREVHARVSELHARATAARLAVEQDERRAGELAGELAALDAHKERLAADIAACREALAAARRAVDEREQERLALEAERERAEAAVQAARAAWNEHRDALHEMRLALEREASQRGALARDIERQDERVATLAARREEVAAAAASAERPIAELQGELQQALARQREAEAGLAAAREAVTRTEQALRDAEARRGEIERRLGALRDALEQARVEQRTLELQAQQIEERITQLGAAREEALAMLEAGDSEESLREALAGIERRITRLGAINLAAIEERAQLAERKEYLDRQHDDLTAALETLEQAIRKIDRETRTRFRETYDAVNARLQELFPMLFGGGHAQLQMTGEDLLETGVTVMARPPGKRNGSIHLLSGGEKALTALAFVFAIFQLNPAPFCLLDEVDAPLDDVNVHRFCELVRSMAEQVQFVIVTHNKITMEMAEQLIGVTMQEPGVSRLVAVDIGRAVEMAASA